METLVFLDIDGVLNSVCWFSANASQDSWPQGHLDPSAVRRLSQLVEEVDADVVISSAWRRAAPLSRYSGDPEVFRSIAGLLGQAGFTRPERIIGQTPSTGLRSHEITGWLDQHAPRHERPAFVVFDDDPDACVPYHTVLTDPFVGLTDTDVNVALGILGRA